MLRFRVFENGAPATTVDLRGAHLLGAERVPIRAELRFEKGHLVCEPRSRAAAALAIQWNVPGFGKVMLETPRLLDRAAPYDLLCELARGQLMRISLKREDWGLYGAPDSEEVIRTVDTARDFLLTAITCSNEAECAAHAEKALIAALNAGEAVSGLHASICLGRRRATSQVAQRPLGCRLDIAEVYTSGASTAHPQRLPGGLDFVSVPMPWRVIEEKEGKASLAAIEPWVRIVKERKLQLWAGSLLSFDDVHRPDWWSGSSKEKDYVRLRDAAAKHLRQMYKALAPHVQAWEIASGLHAYNPLKLKLEQVMELTRLSSMLARQASPKTQAILTIVPPWPDYYAADPQTVPPLLYAEMAIQSGISFDALGIEIRFGHLPADNIVRDMLQVSSMLDRFGNLGKPIHVVAAGVPSCPDGSGGSWRGPWSEEIQARWLAEFYATAFARPFVETVSWHGLADSPNDPAASCLLRSDLSPRPALQKLQSFRESLLTAGN